MKEIEIKIEMTKEDDKKYSTFISKSIEIMKLKEKKSNLEFRMENLVFKISLLEEECMEILNQDSN